MKLALGLILLAGMSLMAGCANYGQVKSNAKLTANERYELGLRADKLEGLKPVPVVKVKKEAANVK
ncbi:MAG: hypothetical protein M1273_08210 [Deltaproteobacteria bacterium]|jgi:hypothetical protein|nr:hypothetical protein [Deltaproteobacteria bacterium]